MISNIGDTPQQLEQGLMFDGEVWTKERIQALQVQVKQLRKYGNLLCVSLAYSTDAFAEGYRSLWKEALNKTPTQYLAERDAEVAVKAIDDLNRHLCEIGCGDYEHVIDEYVNQLRKQTKGGE